jgi:hypothetical protein
MPLALQLDITCSDCADDKEGPTADMPDEVSAQASANRPSHGARACAARSRLSRSSSATSPECAHPPRPPAPQPHLHTLRRVTPDEPGDASPAKAREGWRGPPPADEGPKAHQQQQQHHHHQREPSPPPPPAPPRETPPFGVLRSAATGATYALLKVLVHDKTDVTVMLGAPVRYEGQWPERRAVLERRRVVIKVRRLKPPPGCIG